MSFNVQKARAAGAKDEDIIEHLTNTGRTPEEIKQLMTTPAVEVPMEKPYNVYSSMADIVSNDMGKAKQALGNKDVALPLRAGGAALEAAQIPVDVGLEAVGGGLKTIGERLGIAQPIKKGLASIMDNPVMNKYQQGVESIKEGRPNLQAADRAAFNLMNIIPGIGPVARGTGSVLSGAGKAALKGEMKIDKPLAIQAGPTVRAGKNKIINDIEKYKLESPLGGFEGVAEKAQKAIDDRMNISKDELDKVTKQHPDKTISLDGNVASFKSDLIDGNIDGIPFEKIDDALAITDELMGKAKTFLKKDPEGPVALSFYEADRARQMFNDGVWKKGAYSPTVGNVRESISNRIKEELAIKMRNAVGDYIPAQKMANREIRDLINIRTAADAALTRIESHNPIFNAGNFIAGGMGSLIGGQAGDLSAGMMAGIGAKNMLQKGRGSSALIKGGRTLQQAPKLTDIIRRPKTLPDILQGVK